MWTLVASSDLKPHHRQQILAACPNISLRCASERKEPDRLIEWAEDADILFGFGQTSLTFNTELLARARKLRWLQTYSSGVNHLPLAALREHAVLVTNVRGIHSDTIADHVLFFLLYFARNYAQIARLNAARRWAWVPATRLRGQVVCIVGLGAIGQAVALRAQACGMKVIGIRRHPQPTDHVDQVYGPADLCAVLSEADAVVLACPFTPETREMIGAGELQSCKPSVHLINVARGNIVDEAALLAALHQGQIAGAGLDCFEQEPLPSDSPFYTLENVVISPHMAGSQSDHMDLAIEILCENLQRFRDNQPLRNLVRPELGY